MSDSFEAFMADTGEARRSQVNFVKFIEVQRGEVLIEIEDLDDGTYVLDLATDCCNNVWLAATDHEYWLCASCVTKRLYRGSSSPNFYDRYWTATAAEDWLSFVYPAWSPLELALASELLYETVRVQLMRS